MSILLQQEEFPVKGINFLLKVGILFDIMLSKITLFWAKYLSKTMIFPRSEKHCPTLVLAMVQSGLRYSLGYGTVDYGTVWVTVHSGLWQVYVAASLGSGTIL